MRQIPSRSKKQKVQKYRSYLCITGCFEKCDEIVGSVFVVAAEYNINGFSITWLFSSGIWKKNFIRVRDFIP